MACKSTSCLSSPMISPEIRDKQQMVFRCLPSCWLLLFKVISVVCPLSPSLKLLPSATVSVCCVAHVISVKSQSACSVLINPLRRMINRWNDAIYCSTTVQIRKMCITSLIETTKCSTSKRVKRFYRAEGRTTQCSMSPRKIPCETGLSRPGTMERQTHIH